MRKRMNFKDRLSLHTIRPNAKHRHDHRIEEEIEEEKKIKIETLQMCEPIEVRKAVPIQPQSEKDREMELQQEIDKLQKQLRHEESVHRILERALTGPLSALSHFPSYLPPHTSQLLKDIAALEEEVIQLEEQVITCKQELYQEANLKSSSKAAARNASDPLSHPCPNADDTREEKSLVKCVVPESSESDHICQHVSLAELLSSSECSASDQILEASEPRGNCLSLLEQLQIEEDQHSTNIPKKKSKDTLPKKPPRSKKLSDLNKKQHEAQANKENKDKLIQKEGHPPAKVAGEDKNESETDFRVNNETGSPNKISEDILNCLVSIFLTMSTVERDKTDTKVITPGISRISECPTSLDPYGISHEIKERDVGPYKHCHSVQQSSINPTLVPKSSPLFQKLKTLLRKLAFVDPRGLTDHQKLAFWINIYNSCMMNAFLEHEMLTSNLMDELMQKATINVGGHIFNVLNIEHCVLRLPYHSDDVYIKKELVEAAATMYHEMGLDLPEPLVVFAISRGCWSSPAVRVYTASQIENELKSARSEYLQAAVGISAANKLVIPKILDWHVKGFSKDVESRMDWMDWMYLQLPDGITRDASKFIERWKTMDLSEVIQVLPYQFQFRYLLSM